MLNINLGLVGCNNQGREHLNAVCRTTGVKISAICDDNKKILKKTGDDFPDVELFSDLDQFLSKNLDGYILALPHHVYPQIWVKLMEAQKPLLKEKPLGRNLKESISFLNQCQKANIPLVTAIQRRTHPSYSFLKNALKIQNIKEITACLHLGFNPCQKPDSWRGDPEKSGGGALLDSGYHMVDLIHFLVGPFNLIQANIWHNGKLGHAGMIDTDASLIGRRQGTWIRIESSVGGNRDESDRYIKKERIIVKCDKDIFEADREGVKKNDTIIFECSRSWEQAMAAQLMNFAEKIRTDEYDSYEIWEQVPAMKVISMAYKLAEFNAPFNGGYGND